MNCLKLNSSKTEVLIFSPDWWPEELGTLTEPTRKAKNLGVLMDNKLTFEDQVKAVTSTSFHLLRTIRKIMSFLPADSYKVVITALILSRVDYCNSLHLNIQKKHLNSLQLVQNAAARLLTGTPKFVSIKKGIKQLHWLPVKQRIQFKSLCTVFKALHGGGPKHLKQ